MPNLIVVLVQPKVEGNVGAVARAMANFGFSELVLVDPCPLGDEAYRRAKHAGGILTAARVVSTLDEALEGVDLVVGTTGVPSTKEEAFHRQALTPRDIPSHTAAHEGRVALLMGRENYGLFNEELDRLDVLVNVPCSPEYPILNLSHAAAILLYEVSQARGGPSRHPRPASGLEMAKFREAFDELLTAIRYPPHKRRRTEVMFRRLLGRAAPSKWEFHALMGVLRGATKSIRRLSGFPALDLSS